MLGDDEPRASRPKEMDLVVLDAVRSCWPLRLMSVVEALPRLKLRGRASVSFPVESNVLVALPPKYAVPKVEKLVVDAPAEKSWSAVQVLATESETPPLPVPTHVPFTAKHPAERLRPFAKVDDAEVPVILRYGDCRPAENVDVAPALKVKAPVEPLIASAETVLVLSAVEVAR